jgi:mRNA interferase MazF
MFGPERGDIIKFDFYNAQGHEQAGYRPALVISPGIYNSRSGLAIVCSITNQVKSTAFEVALPSGLTTTGVVLTNHIYNIDWVIRRAKIIEKAPDDVFNQVSEIIQTFLFS